MSHFLTLLRRDLGLLLHILVDAAHGLNDDRVAFRRVDQARNRLLEKCKVSVGHWARTGLALLRHDLVD